MSFQMIRPNICKNRKESIEKNTENSKKIQQISSVLVSVAAVTNYQNILGLKQQKCITLQFWVSLGSNQGWQDYIPSEGSREKSVFLPFPASGSHSYSLSCGPLLSSKPETATQTFPTSHLANNFIPASHPRFSLTLVIILATPV